MQRPARSGFFRPGRAVAPRPIHAPVTPPPAAPPPPQGQPVMPDLGDLPMPSDDFTIDDVQRAEDPFLDDLFGSDDGEGGGGEDVLGASQGRYFIYVEGAGEVFDHDDEGKVNEAYNDWIDHIRRSDTPNRGILLLDRTLAGTPVVLKKGGNPITVMGVDWPSVYEAGESQVKSLVQFFNSLHRPAKYEPAVEGVYTEYENAKTSWLTNVYPGVDKLFEARAATLMKQIGEKAAGLQSQIASDQGVAAPPGMAHETPLIPDLDYGKYLIIGGVIIAVGAGLWFFGPALFAMLGGAVKRRISYPRLHS